MLSTIAAAAHERAKEITDRPVIVTIDGRSSTGKTTLADDLSAHLHAAPVVHMDDLYPGWDGLAAALPSLSDDVLIPLRANHTAVYQRYDWDAGEYGEELVVEPSRFVIVEGCGSSVGPAGQLSDLRIWLEADGELRRRRGIARDAGIFDEHWDHWAEQEEALFSADATRDHADLIFDTGALIGDTA